MHVISLTLNCYNNFLFSDNKLVQIKKGGSTSNNNVQANTNNIKEETPETEQREASGSDIVRPLNLTTSYS